MNILTSRAAAGGEYGIACGPVGFDTASAEMSIDDNGSIVWISTNWQSEMPELMQVNVTKESMFKYYSGIPEYDENGDEIELDYSSFDGGDEYTFESIDEYDGPYKELIPQLLKMLYEAMEKKGYVSEDRFEYKEEIWPWLTEIGIDYDIPTEEEDIARIEQEYGLSPDLSVIPYDDSMVTIRGNHIISFKRGKDRIFNAGMVVHLPEGDLYLHEQIDWNGKKEFSVGTPDLDPMDAYRKIDEHDPDPNYSLFHEAYWSHLFEVRMSEDQAMKTRYRDYFKKIDSYIKDRDDKIMFD